MTDWLQMPESVHILAHHITAEQERGAHDSTR